MDVQENGNVTVENEENEATEVRYNQSEEIETVDSPENQSRECSSGVLNDDPFPVDQKQTCPKCGASVEIDQLFCSKCGKRLNKKEISKKTIIAIIISVGIILGIASIICFILIRGVQAQSITLSKESIEVKAGNTVSLSCTIAPDNTKNKDVIWESSNDLIATAGNGLVLGINEGNCTITVITSNGKTDTCVVTVLPPAPDLKEIHDKYCNDIIADLASDGSYLSIDTNIFDIDDYSDYKAYSAIKEVNNALGLPQSLMNRMNQTRAIDGMQSYSTDDLEITWTYHPDNGLEVTYSIK